MKASNGILSVVSLNHFVNDGSSSLIASLFPAMEVAFGFPTYYVGILVALGYLVLMILQPLIGTISERFQSLKFLPIGISIIALSMLLFIFSSDFLSILVSFIVLRVGTSFFHPIGASAISRVYSGPTLDRSMAIESSVGNLGIIFSFFLSAPLYLTFGWTGPFVLYLGIQIATIVLTLVFVRISVPKGTPQNEKEERLSSRATELSENPAQAVRKHLLGLPVIFIVIGFVTGGSNSTFSNFGNLALYQSGFSYGAANDLIGVFEFVSFMGALIAGWLTIRMRRPSLLVLSYLFAGISTLIFSFIHRESYSYAAPLFASGFFLAITYPVTYSELSDFSATRKTNRGTGFGVLFSAQIAGSAVMGYVGGYLSKTIGLNHIFTVVSVLLIATSVIVWLGGDYFGSSKGSRSAAI